MTTTIRKKIRKADTVLTPDRMYNEQLYTFNEDQLSSLLNEVRKEGLNEVIDYLNIKKESRNAITISEIGHYIDKIKEHEKY